MTTPDANTERFRQVIGQLREAGLNAATLDQVARSGTVRGLPVAEGIAFGGEGAIRQVNELEAQVRAAAANLSDDQLAGLAASAARMEALTAVIRRALPPIICEHCGHITDPAAPTD